MLVSGITGDRRCLCFLYMQRLNPQHEKFVQLEQLLLAKAVVGGFQ
jgi:hypothetical protein